MTCAYTARLFLWSALPLSLLLVFLLSFPLGWGGGVWIPLFLLLLLVSLPLWFETTRTRIRAGTSPYLSVWKDERGGVRRKGEKEIVYSLEASLPSSADEEERQEQDWLLPVGGGWSFFLRRRRARGCFFTTHSLSGLLPNGRWGAGTRIRDVQSSLCREGLSLPGHPSISTSTLGGWLFSLSHGSGGTLWKPAFGKKVFLDQQTGKTFLADKSPYSDLKSEEEQRRYILLEVEVHPVRNEECDRIAFDVESEEDARRYIQSHSFLRMIFVTATCCVCFLWVRPAGGTSPPRPPPPSLSGRLLSNLFPPWLASLLPPLLSSFPRRWWTRRMTLREGNMFNIDPPVFGSFFSSLLSNFELFVHLPSPTVDASLLLRLCQANKDLFLSMSGAGRCEIRGGARGILFLDYAVPNREESISSCLTLVRSVFGKGVRIGLHKGKATVPDHLLLGPCLGQSGE